MKVGRIQVDMPADFPALSLKEVTLGMEDAAMFAHLVVWGCRRVERRSLESCCGHLAMNFFHDLEEGLHVGERRYG